MPGSPFFFSHARQLRHPMSAANKEEYVKFTKMWAAGIAAGVAAFALTSGPASAWHTVAPPVADPSGVDFDAACVIGRASSVESPFGDGCDGISTYDGSTESTDLRSVDLKKNAAGQLEATFTVDGPIPPAGSQATTPALGTADPPTPQPAARPKNE